MTIDHAADLALEQPDFAGPSDREVADHVRPFSAPVCTMEDAINNRTHRGGAIVGVAIESVVT